MINHILFLLVLTCINIVHLAGHDYCAVFVHVGSEVPPHAMVALEQFRLFNPSCPTYFIGHRRYIDQIAPHLEANKIIGIAAEALRRTPTHDKFLQTSTLNRTSAQGFWFHTSERFFYIEELAIQYELGCIFHLENDIMIYRNLEELLPTLRKHYRGIAMTFGCDYLAVPGFVYIPSLSALQEITTYLLRHAHEAKNECELISELQNTKGPDYVDYLPTIFPEYAQKYPLINAQGISAKQPERFYRLSTEFSGVFDAAAMGQYLGGLSPLNGSLPGGFVNSYSVFNPALLSFVWHKDAAGRKVPYAKLGAVEYPINNLHVHSKKLEGFRS